jgi:hypothetical protein
MALTGDVFEVFVYSLLRLARNTKQPISCDTPVSERAYRMVLAGVFNTYCPLTRSSQPLDDRCHSQENRISCVEEYQL